MRKIILLILGLLVLIPQISYATARQGTKKVAIVVGSITSPFGDAQNKYSWRARDIMYNVTTSILDAHHVPYEVYHVGLDETGWLTRTGLVKGSISSDIGVIMVIGGVAGDPNNSANQYFTHSGKLYEAWDSDSTSVPVLNIFTNEAHPYTINTTNDIDIGLSDAALAAGNPYVYRIDYGHDVEEARFHCGYTNKYGKWEGLGFHDVNGYIGAYYYSEIDPDWDGGSSGYGFTGLTPMIWLNGTPTAPSDSVIAWKISRDKSAEPVIMAHIGTFGQYNYNFTGTELVLPLLLNLEPDLYYETMERVAILDDLGMPGVAGLIQGKERNGVTADDIEVLCNDFAEFDMKGIFAIATDYPYRGEINPTEFTYGVNLRTPNESWGQLLAGARHKDRFKFSPVWHNHVDNRNKAHQNSPVNATADQPIESILNTWIPIYKQTLDSLNWKWSNNPANYRGDIFPVALFAGDQYSNTESTNDPDPETDSWNQHLWALIATDSDFGFGARTIRAGSGFGNILPDMAANTGTGTRLSNIGVMPLYAYDESVSGWQTMKSIMMYSESFYMDGFLPGWSDSIFCRDTTGTFADDVTNLSGGTSAAESTRAEAAIYNSSGLRQSSGLGTTGGLWGTLYEYGYPAIYNVSADNTSGRQHGMVSSYKSPYETWHTYNWIPITDEWTGVTQRKGQEWTRFLNAKIGYLHYIAGVDDLIKYTWGTGYQVRRQAIRTRFDVEGVR